MRDNGLDSERYCRRNRVKGPQGKHVYKLSCKIACILYACSKEWYNDTDTAYCSMSVWLAVWRQQGTQKPWSQEWIINTRQENQKDCCHDRGVHVALYSWSWSVWQLGRTSSPEHCHSCDLTTINTPLENRSTHAPDRVWHVEYDVWSDCGYNIIFSNSCIKETIKQRWVSVGVSIQCRFPASQVSRNVEAWSVRDTTLCTNTDSVQFEATLNVKAMPTHWSLHTHDDQTVFSTILVPMFAIRSGRRLKYNHG